MKGYLISDYKKGIMSDDIPILAKSPKEAAEQYRECKVKRIPKKGYCDYDLTLREGRIEGDTTIFKYGASLFLYKTL